MPAFCLATGYTPAEFWAMRKRDFEAITGFVSDQERVAAERNMWLDLKAQAKAKLAQRQGG